MYRVSFLRAVSLILCLAPVWGLCTVAADRSEARPDFSGTWKQSNERCVPKRNGDVTLRITQEDPRFTVETTILHGTSPARHAIQQYSTDGKVSVSTGADGDEFHTSISWSGAGLVFAVEEHEDGRILLSKEIWTLTENGAVLQRVRRRSDSGEEQTMVYVRSTVGNAGL